MARPRKADHHLPVGLYVRHGRWKDTYWTIIAGKYHGLGNERVDAERRLRDLRSGMPEEQTIAGLAERYIARLRQQRQEGAQDALSERTIADYADALEKRLVPVFGHWRPDQFRPTDAAQYLARPENRQRRVRANREVAALGSMFAFAMRLGLVDENPCHGVKRNREFSRRRKPEIAELNTLLEVARGMGEGAYTVALIAAMVGLTGRRRAEVLNLQRGHLREDGIAITAAKLRAGEQREYLVAWSPTLRQVVEAALGRKREVESFYVFASSTGNPYSDAGFKAVWSRIMRRHVEAGGTHFTAHDLRALYVTETLDRGGDPGTHKDPSTMHRVYRRRNVVKVKPLA